MKLFIKLIFFHFTLVFAQAASFTCSTNAYIFSSETYESQTDSYSFDLSNGDQLSNQSNLHPYNINAIGYNVIDNHIWGYDRGKYQVVQIDGDYHVTGYAINELPSFAPADDITPTYHAGDVSMGGILHLFTVSDPETIYRVDTNHYSTNYLKALSPIKLSEPIEFSDFAFSPINNLLYAIDYNENLIRIDQNSGIVTRLGHTTMPPIGNVASVFFDKEGNFYAHHSHNANIYTIEIPDEPQILPLKATFFSNIGTTSHGDGARCAKAGLFDYKITATAQDVQDLEGNSKTTDFNVTVTLDKPAPDKGLMLSYQTADGTALNALEDTRELTGYDPTNPDHVNYKVYWNNWLIFAVSYWKYNTYYAELYPDYRSYYINELGKTPNDDAAIIATDANTTETNTSITLTTPIVDPDYLQKEGTLFINPGETVGTITLDIIGDTIEENNETFSLKLFAPSNVEVLNNEVSITILNDDSKPSNPLGCSEETSYLLHDAQVSEFDMSTGQLTLVRGKQAGVETFGYNPIDGYLWGTGSNDGSIVKIGKQSNSNQLVLEEMGLIEGLPARSYQAGDVSSNGKLYLKSQTINEVFVVNVNANDTDNYLKLERTFSLDTNIFVADWAFNPKDGMLYGVERATTSDPTRNLYRIDPSQDKNNLIDLGDTQITGDPAGGFGAQYFDAEGFLYLVNGLGEIYKIDISNPSSVNAKAKKFGHKTTTSLSIDGARCPNAPLSYAKIIADYHFDACSWDGTPNEVKDSSGNGFDGVAMQKTNTDTLEGQINGSAQFTNSTDSVKIEGITGLDSNNFTLSFWTKIDFTGETQVTKSTHKLIKLGNVNANRSANGDDGIIELRYREDNHELRVTGERIESSVSGGINGYSQTITVDLNDEKWHHIVLTYHDENMKIYVDTINSDMLHPSSGISGVSQLGQLDAFNGVLEIGSTQNNLFITQTHMDEVKLYNSALSATQITALYNNELVHKNGDGTLRNTVNCDESLIPFICDDTLYLSNKNNLGTGITHADSTWLHAIDQNSTPFGYSAIGDAYINESDGYNALGYNTQDNFMYALDGNTLLQIDSNATVKKLGMVTGLNPEQLYAGAFDRSGFFYASGNGAASSELYKIDINTSSVVETITLIDQNSTLPVSVHFWDMAIDETGEYFYVMLIQDGDEERDYTNDKFAKINIKTGELTTLGGDKSNMHSYVSLIFSDKDGDVFVMSNEDGFYKVNTNNGDLYELASTQNLALYNDGTNCADANISAPPSMTINDVEKFEGDSGLTEFKFTVSLDKPALENSGFWFTLTDGIDAKIPIETAVQTPGIDNDYKGDSAYISIPTGLQKVDIIVNVVGDTIMEQHEEFYVDLYSPSNLLITDSRGVGTILNDDLVLFNAERTNSNTVDNATQVQKESLYTQISGRDFNYALVSYSKDQATSSEAAIENVTLKVELIDNATHNSNKVLYTNYVYFPKDSPHSRVNLLDKDDLALPIATHEAQYKISYLLDANGSLIYGAYNNEIEYNATKRLAHQENSTLSRDRFAIRPASYRMTIKGFTDNSGSDDSQGEDEEPPVDPKENNDTLISSARSMMEAASALFASPALQKDSASTIEHTVTNNVTVNYMGLATEHEYLLSMHATQYASENIALGYTTLNQNAIDAELIFNNKTTLTCDDENDYKQPYLFTDGSSNNNPLMHDNVGNYALHIKDSNWTAIDQNSNTSLGCIPNSSMISASGDEKSGCNIESNLTNAQPNYLPKHYNIDIDFEAYSFDLSTISVQSNTNLDHNYVYMNNLSDNPAMSMRIAGDIIAKGEQGATLTNFTGHCMAKEIELTIEHNITSDQGSSSTDTTHFKTTNGTALQSSIIVQHNGITTSSVDGTLNSPIRLQSNDFIDTNKGRSSFTLLYNIEKSINQPSNPIEIAFHAIDANASTARSSIDNKAWTASGKVTLNSNKFFYYARLAPDMENYNTIFDGSLPTPINIEIFCDQNRSWCDAMLGENGHEGINTQAGWYSAVKHNPATDGGIISFISNNPKITVTPISSVKYNKGRYSNVITQNTLPMTQRKEHAKINIIATSWLLYHGTSPGGIPFWTINFEKVEETSPSGVGLSGHQMEIERSSVPVNRMDW